MKLASQIARSASVLSKTARRMNRPRCVVAVVLNVSLAVVVAAVLHRVLFAIFVFYAGD